MKHLTSLEKVLLVSLWVITMAFGFFMSGRQRIINERDHNKAMWKEWVDRYFDQADNCEKQKAELVKQFLGDDVYNGRRPIVPSVLTNDFIVGWSTNGQDYQWNFVPAGRLGGRSNDLSNPITEDQGNP